MAMCYVHVWEYINKQPALLIATQWQKRMAETGKTDVSDSATVILLYSV